MFVILTVCVYVLPAGTFTKLTASGAASIKAEAVTWDSGTPVPARVAPLAACIADRYIADTTKNARPKLPTLMRLQKHLPTINVPLDCLPPPTVALPRPRFQTTGREFTGGQGRAWYSPTLRGIYRFDPIELLPGTVSAKKNDQA